VPGNSKAREDEALQQEWKNKRRKEPQRATDYDENATSAMPRRPADAATARHFGLTREAKGAPTEA